MGMLAVVQLQCLIITLFGNRHKTASERGMCSTRIALRIARMVILLGAGPRKLMGTSGGVGSLEDDPQWVLASQQAQRYEMATRGSLEKIAEQQRQFRAEEELAKKDRSPFLPDIFYKPINHPERIFENCAFKSAFGGVAGMGFGFMLGVFFASTAYDAQMVEGPGTTYQKVIEGFKATGRQGVSSAKNFGMVSVVFAGTECLIEKHRAKSDRYNGAAGGCILM